MRRDEYNNESLREFADPGREFAEQDNEMPPYLDNEVSTPASEYGMPGDEFNDGAETGSVQEETKKTDYRKLIRKMSYLVAAAASAVVMGKTVDLPAKPPTEQVEAVPEKEEQEFEWPEVPGFDSGAEEQPEAEPEAEVLPAKADGKLVSLAAYDSYGYGNGGVIPVMKGGRWGMIDYKGNELLEPQFDVFVSSPNDNGYAVWSNEGTYSVTDKTGQVVLEFSGDVYSVTIGESDVVVVKQARGSYEEREVRFRYLRVNGTVLYDTGWIFGEEYFNEAGDFLEGKAYLYLSGDYRNEEVPILYELTLDGSIREIDRDETLYREDGSWWGVSSTYAPIGAVSEGWYLAQIPGGGGGWHLFHPDTLEATPRTLGYMDPGGSNFKESTEIMGYKENGAMCFNYGTKGVMRIYTDYEGPKERDVLFDFANANEYVSSFGGHWEYISNIIASYDTIIMDNFPYLAVQNGDDTFYIDLNGNIVSEVYETATSFNDRGFAMVQEGNTAYIINSAFERVETIEGIQAIGFNDDTFVVEYPDGTLAMYCFEE